MKKFSLILLMALAVFGSVYAQFDAGNDTKGLVPWRLHAYSKDWMMTFPVTEVAADTILPETRYFIVPEAAELMRAWYCAYDTSLSATAGFTVRIHSGASAADTAAYLRSANNTRAGKVFTNGTTAERSFSSREIGYIYIDTIGAYSKPENGTVFMLFRPKSYPTDADSLYKR